MRVDLARIQKLAVKGKPVLGQSPLGELLAKVAWRSAQQFSMTVTPTRAKIISCHGYILIHLIEEGHNCCKEYVGILRGEISVEAQSRYLNAAGNDQLHISCSATWLKPHEIGHLKTLLSVDESQIGEIHYCYTEDFPTFNASYWDKGMTERDVNYYRCHIYPLFLDELKKEPRIDGAIICDPGCCTGGLIKEVRTFFSQARVIGSDANNQAVEIARGSNPGIQIVKSDAGELTYLNDGEVDIFLLSGLLTKQVVSWSSAWTILHRVFQKLRPEGKALVHGLAERHFNQEDFERAGFKVLKRAKISSGLLVPFYIIQRPPVNIISPSFAN